MKTIEYNLAGNIWNRIDHLSVKLNDEPWLHKTVNGKWMGIGGFYIKQKGHNYKFYLKLYYG